MKKSTKTFLIAVLSVLSGWSNVVNAQWEVANGGLPTNEVNSLATIGSTLYASTGNISGNGMGVFKSTDHGTSWTACNNGLLSLDTRQIIAVLDTLYVAVAGVNLTDGGIYKSTDHGDTWVQINTGLNRNISYSIVHNQGVLYTTINAPMSFRAVYTSSDFGNNWTITSDPVLNDNKIKSILNIGGNIIAGSDGGTGGVIVSTDGGATWITTSITNGTDDLDVIGTTVYAATGIGVKKSVDNGLTWTNTTNTSGVIDNSTSLGVIGNCLFVGTPGGSVFSTSDGGTTWKNESTGAPGALAPEEIIKDDTYMYAATNFKTVGIWRRLLNDFECGSTTGIEIVPEPAIEVFPNPSKGIFTLVSGSSVSEINVYNVLGELIHSQKTDASTITIDLSGKPAGVYFYQVSGQEQGVRSGKMVLE